MGHTRIFKLLGHRVMNVYYRITEGAGLGQGRRNAARQGWPIASDRLPLRGRFGLPDSGLAIVPAARQSFAVRAKGQCTEAVRLLRQRADEIA